MMKQSIKFFISILFLFLLIFIPVKESFSQMPPPGNFKPKPDIDTSQYKYKWLDIAYAKQSKAQTLDIYLPDNKDKFPLIIAIHGGGWDGGDKRSGEITPILEAIKRGYAVASINYRLSGEAKFPAQIYDVKAAIRYLRANADKYKLNPAKFGVWGGSAGGHLAALAGTSGDVAEIEDLNMGNKEISSRVQAVVLWYGHFLLDNALQYREPLVVKLFSPDVNETSVIVKKALPAKYISGDDPPFFIEHGNKDRAISFAGSVFFAGALQKVLGKEKVKFKIIEGADHLDPLFETGQNISETLDFLDKALSGKISSVSNTDKQITQISSPEAETRGRALLNNMFKALGGRETLAAIKTIKTTFQINQDVMSFTRIVTVSNPDKVHIEEHYPIGDLLLAFTKEDAWVKPPNQPAIPLSEEEARENRRGMLRNLHNLALNYEKLKIQYAGQQITNGKALENIMIIQDDDSFRVFIDPDTKLISRLIYTETGPCGLMDITEELSEYKTISGIQLETKGIVMIAGQKFREYSITDIQLNPKVDPKIFKRP